MMQYDDNNIFAKILKGDMPSKKVYEDDHVLAFYDAYPRAKTHVLVIPKGKYISFADFTFKATSSEVGLFFKTVDKIAKEHLHLSHYKLITNNGAESDQMVFHFHVHIMSN